MDDQELSELVVSQGGVARERVLDAQQFAERFHQPLATVLIERNEIEKVTLGRLIGQAVGFEYIDLQHQTIAPDVLGLIGEEIAQAKSLVPFRRHGKILSIAFAHPQDFELINFLQKKTGYHIRPFFAFPEDLNAGFVQYKRDIKHDFARILSAGLPTTVRDEDLAKVATHIPVIEAFDTILEYAIAERASDLHFEIEEEGSVVRFRIDGILHDILNLSHPAHTALVARIKILANLKIDEHRRPQDGRFQFDSLGAKTALRVSIIPSFYGENVVLRLLFESEKPKTLAELGCSPDQEAVILQNMRKTHGMLLVTGPTGSGKTTTLYSILHLLNSPETKLCTVEDPIEYGIARISQIQVNPVAGLDFATGLRALLRHDPDIIMVGEIRDRETTNTAIQAALTGHLVLSTLHTNDAPSAIPRFLDLGSEAFLLASTLKLVIAQRLVRKVCPECRTADRPSPVILKEVAALAAVPLAQLRRQRFVRGQGCRACHTSGYRGRFGILELFEVTPAIENAIRDQVSLQEIRALAVKGGMVPMFADGVQKAIAGQTTLEEVLRVSRE